MGLKKWEEAFKPMGKPNGLNFFTLWADSNSTKLFKKKRFLSGEWKNTNPQNQEKEKLQNQQL